MSEKKFVTGEQHKQITSSRAPKQNSYNKVGVAVAVVILFSAISFYSGIQYEKNHVKTSVATASKSGFLSSGSGGARGGFARRGGGLGQVTAVTPTSITINNERSGTSETFSITSSTAITDNGNTVTYSDIQSGDTVIVMTSGSGSTTATSVLVNPSTSGGFGSGGGSGSQGSTLSGTVSN